MENVDCYISENGYFIASSYNIKNLIDFSDSNISTMPEILESSVKIAGRDGDIVLSSKYEPIPFNIVCYTDENLTPEQKILEENKIKTFLHNIKQNTVKLGMESRSIYYDVKYSGSLTVVRYPKSLKFSISLKSSSSYGKVIPGKIITGNNSKSSATIKDVGVKFTILGPATSPSIAFNDYLIEFYDNLLNNESLIIDSSKSTVTHINAVGKKTNRIMDFNHQFPKAINGTNTLQVVSGIEYDNKVTAEWNDLTL